MSISFTKKTVASQVKHKFPHTLRSPMSYKEAGTWQIWLSREHQELCRGKDWEIFFDDSKIHSDPHINSTASTAKCILGFRRIHLIPKDTILFMLSEEFQRQ